MDVPVRRCARGTIDGHALRDVGSVARVEVGGGDEEGCKFPVSRFHEVGGLELGLHSRVRVRTPTAAVRWRLSEATVGRGAASAQH